MNRKLLASTVVVASLLAPAVAFAQADNMAPPAGSNAPGMQKPANHPTKTHRGTTTGMNSSTKSHTSGKSDAHKSGSSY